MDKAKIVIVGAGMGGLAAALALKDQARQIRVLERDPESPLDDPKGAFDGWSRTGVPQFKHSHMLLSRLRTVIRDHHPQLLSELEAAGIHASSLDELLPPKQAEQYVPVPEDDDLLHFWGRRATFEAVVRRYLTRFDNVTFVHDARVEGLVTERAGDAILVKGVEVNVGGQRSQEMADVIVDASGKRASLVEELRKAGATVEEETSPAGFSYHCRHYKLTAPYDAPRRGTGAILDYLWYGMFFAEDGHFSIALACPVEEEELARTLRRVDGFELICKQMPVLQGWRERAEPVSSVMGAGKLQNRWTRIAHSGPGHVLGLFCVGDALIQSNPMYGRGCSSAFVQAHELADVLATSSDPQKRAQAYAERLHKQIRPYFDFAVVADRLFLARAKMARGEAVPTVDRLLNHFYEEVWNPAALEDPFIGREAVRAMEMREASPLLVRLQVILRLIGFWIRRKVRGTTQAAPLQLGPSRNQLLLRLPSGTGEAQSQNRATPHSV